MHKRSPEVTAFWAHVLVENLSNLVACLYSLAHVRLSGVLRMGGRFRPGVPAISEDWEEEDEEEVRAALQNLAREAQEEFLEECHHRG